jgi:hypothetical protein
MPDKIIDSASADATPHREFHSGRLIAICLFLIVACVLVFGYHYRLHFYWAFYASREPVVQQVHAVPVSSMPDSPVPDDWVHCRYGPLEFDLPQDLADKVDVKSQTLYFKDEQRALLVAPLTDASEFMENLRKDLPPPRLGEGLSWLDLHLATFRADYNEFRWSMSPDEVAWLSWRIGFNLLRGKTESVETIKHDDLEGFLAYSQFAGSFEWNTKDGRVQGVCTYINKNWTAADSDTIRRVSQSLKITGKIYPVTNPKTDEEVRASFEVLPKGK